MSIIINNLSYRHHNREMLFENIDIVVNSGEKVALTGNNGCGKSTLMRILSGELTAAGGEVVLSEPPYYVPQHVGQYDECTVAEVLGVGEKIEALHAILRGEASEENFNRLHDDWAVEEDALAALSAWGLAHVSLERKLGSLSGGEKTKVFLAGWSLHRPCIVLLDEPTNHLDGAGRRLLYEQVERTKSTLLVVSHDRALLNLLERTVELTRDGVEAYGGNYDFYKACKEEKAQVLREQLSEKEKELRKAKRVAREAIERKEKDGVRGKKRKQKEGIPAIVLHGLQSKAQQSAARLKGVHDDKIDSLVHDLKKARQELPVSAELKMVLQGSHLHRGKMLVSLEAVNFAYPSGEPLWSVPCSLQLRSGERVAIRGGNGSGKTTLIKLMLGKLQPTAGKITRNDFSYLYVDQEYSVIDNRLTVLEQMERYNSRGLTDTELKTLLHRFLFPIHTWDKTCGKLSGGERMKLLLCSLHASNQVPDVLVLDEPTNNLDIQNIEVLTAVVAAYTGTILLVSHDEYFMREIGVTASHYTNPI